MAHSIEHRDAFTGYHYALTDRIIRIFQEVAHELGVGFPLSVYRRALCAALQQAELRVEQQFPIPVRFRGVTVGQFQADLVIENAILLQLSVADEIAKQSENQLQQYLSVSTIEVGLMLVFGQKALFKCLLMNNGRKHGPVLLPPLPNFRERS